MLPHDAIARDNNLFAIAEYPLVTIYDDNLFVRNDYDVLSFGQRKYLINFFSNNGYTQSSGKKLTNLDKTIHFLGPSSNLAVSSFQPEFLNDNKHHAYCVTPTMFAEVICNKWANTNETKALNQLFRLIQTCPYNIEWLRDISYRSEIENFTKFYYPRLLTFQQKTINKKFKHKKAL
ncbi:hypothetical protein RT723_07595 [Psychrosphaera aquimarina]|uniref:Uncharacterized protein n=1 Tax=Psychrosphaera aquimarina TaxID=2044854 RepID=A0ABU3QZL3_9GAMM|nr:hypothetical protein [Psychrosphaera aquimarina]MDU0112863.1 hypothetical protein [Psychrosphaera aquimarina]